jgi:lipoprotein-anchoring transpeptidase ErfK/SrfK
VRRVGAALIAVALAAGGCSAGHPAAAPRSAALVPTTTSPDTTTTAVPIVISTVAQASGASVAIYDNPGADATQLLTNPQPSGAPLVFLVQDDQRDWLHVLLPVRPNGSTGWIRRTEVTISQHTFRIVVQLSAHQITVYQGPTIIDEEPIGVGTHDTPTPGGLYYTKELLQPPDPNGPYGPYAYGLSGYSNVLTSFAGGDGVIGIHGTNDPTLLGKDVSHGCIRMSNQGIETLAGILPLGVPVDIQP